MKNAKLAHSGILTASVLILAQFSSVAVAQRAPPRSASIANFAAPAETASRSARITRGQIVPRIEPTASGVRITIDTYEVNPGNEAIDFTLQVATRGRGNEFRIHSLLKLENPISTVAHTNGRELVYELTHQQLEEVFSAKFPSAPQIRALSGTPLFVAALWRNGHRWGGTDRGGMIVMPGPVVGNTALEVARPQGLDVAVDISRSMQSRFQDPNHAEGLKRDGQIRSRIEGEGKYQIALEDVPDIKRRLFEIARNPQLAQQVFGDGWRLTVEDRYMRRDAANNLILGADGFPIPDPMVDTYYDNARFDAAANDMAIRYRWTEGNRTGAWNFKPGDSRVTPDGIMYRIEYGVDTTSDQPEAIRRFADSHDPLNPFRIIREKAPNALPSEFFQPSVRVVDHRYKFKLEHTSTLAIEISLDEVTAQNLRTAGRRETRFAQLELDIDHLATASKSKIGVSLGYGNTSTEIGRVARGVTALSRIIGGLALHTAVDLDAASPILTKHANDFSMATRAITSLRQRLLGVGWRIAPQKYALAARDLELIRSDRSSPSVRMMESRDRNVLNPSQSRTAALCRQIFQ